MLIFFLPLFLLLLLIGMPVFFALLAAPGIMIYAEGMDRDIPYYFAISITGLIRFR